MCQKGIWKKIIKTNKIRASKKWEKAVSKTFETIKGSGGNLTFFKMPRLEFMAEIDELVARLKKLKMIKPAKR